MLWSFLPVAALLTLTPGLGLAAIVAASTAAFTAVKLVGAAGLVVLGAYSSSRTTGRSSPRRSRWAR